MKTVWEYSLKTEASRLLHCARQMAVGFYRVNNFIVLPYEKKIVPVTGVNIVTFPELNYKSISGFWKKVKLVDVETLPIKVKGNLVNSTAELLASANLEEIEFQKLKEIWEKAYGKIISEIYKIMPIYQNKIKKITIYPTAFGTSSSFNRLNNKGEIVVYIRRDKGIATLTEAILSALTRADVYKDLAGVWQESEIIVDWLVTKTSLAGIISKHEDPKLYLPTLKGTRTKQQAKLLSKSEEFYKRLGLPSENHVFGLNGKTPEIYKRPIENLTSKEKIIMRLLITNSDSVVSVDDIAQNVFSSDDNFSLYAISKTMERLRKKLEANGVSGSFIQTLRGKGYLLKN